VEEIVNTTHHAGHAEDFDHEAEEGIGLCEGEVVIVRAFEGTPHGHARGSRRRRGHRKRGVRGRGRERLWADGGAGDSPLRKRIEQALFLCLCLALSLRPYVESARFRTDPTRRGGPKLHPLPSRLRLRLCRSPDLRTRNATIQKV
jgi:hypothetical protein